MKKTGSLQRIGNYIAAVFGAAAVAVSIASLFYLWGLCLQGSDIYAQLSRLDIVSQAAEAGNWRPLYTEQWYNGYEVFRYTSPAAYFLIYLLSVLLQVDTYLAICLFYGLLIFVSQMGFFLFGIRLRRMWAAFFTGIGFLFLPSSVYITLQQGCFDIVMGLFLLPLVLFFLYDFLKEKNRLALLPFSLLTAVLILANYILAIVFGIVVLLYLLLIICFTRKWRYELAMGICLLLIYLAMGYVLYPALSGGLLSRSYSLQGSWQLPMGLAFLITALLCLVTADRYRAPGFLLITAGGILTFDFMDPVMRLIPLTVLQRNYWYLLVLSAMLCISLLCWERLRFFFLLLLLAALAGESVPVLCSLRTGEEVAAEQEALIRDYLLADAAACTDNRLALMDDAELGAYPHWYFSGLGIKEMFGFDYDSSATIQSQRYVNEALADGLYDSLFDRLLLYGNDVVVILKRQLSEEGAAKEMAASAERMGYALYAENENAIVWKAQQIQGSYGVITHYKNLAIGSHSAYISYMYPSFGLGRSDCLEDYMVEELEQYERLYLSGFTYRDKEKAENMLSELSRKGVRIYIDMQHLPVNAVTGKNEFMGIYAQYVQFTEDFPVLENDNGNQFKLDFKADGYALWNTVYVSGCERALKESTYKNRNHLVYLGQNGQDQNITYMGFNLVYYYLTTHNLDLRRFLDEALELTAEDLPEHEIVPITVEKGQHELYVNSPADHVNCSIAAVAGLAPDRIVSTEDQFWVVNQGQTVFRIMPTGHETGLFFSIVGLVGIGIVWIGAYVLLESEHRQRQS